MQSKSWSSRLDYLSTGSQDLLLDVVCVGWCERDGVVGASSPSAGRLPNRHVRATFIKQPEFEVDCGSSSATANSVVNVRGLTGGSGAKVGRRLDAIWVPHLYPR